MITQLQANQFLSSIVPFFTQQSLQCTPWFLALFLDAAKNIGYEYQSAVDFLDAVVCDMAKKVYDQKPTFYSEGGLRAQFCLHLIQRKKQQPRIVDHNRRVLREETTSLFSSHFAALDDDDCELYLGNSELLKDNLRWQPCASFPKVKDDSFVYLMLGDGKQECNFPRPFLSPHSPHSKQIMTTMQTFNHLMKKYQSDTGSSVIHCGNNQAVRRDGRKMEAVALVGIEIASHRGGFSGIEIPRFILEFTTELLESHRSISWNEHQVRIPTIEVSKKKRKNDEVPLESTLSNLPPQIQIKKFPYLSPANESWSAEFKNIDGVNWVI